MAPAALQAAHPAKLTCARLLGRAHADLGRRAAATARATRSRARPPVMFSRIASSSTSALPDGSASRLFRALDRRREAAGDTDPWVALKVVTAPTAADASRGRCRRCAGRRRSRQRLEHPNLPHILGIDHDGPHTFLCMAWLEGESLAAILDSRGPRPMTRVQAMHIVEGVGRALVHVHAQGITHADVKPGNILVTAEGNATLLDFGVALGPGAGDLPAGARLHAGVRQPGSPRRRRTDTGGRPLLARLCRLPDAERSPGLRRPAMRGRQRPRALGRPCPPRTCRPRNGARSTGHSPSRAPSASRMWPRSWPS